MYMFYVNIFYILFFNYLYYSVWWGEVTTIIAYVQIGMSSKLSIENKCVILFIFTYQLCVELYNWCSWNKFNVICIEQHCFLNIIFYQFPFILFCLFFKYFFQLIYVIISVCVHKTCFVISVYIRLLFTLNLALFMLYQTFKFQIKINVYVSLLLMLDWNRSSFRLTINPFMHCI